MDLNTKIQNILEEIKSDIGSILNYIGLKTMPSVNLLLPCIKMLNFVNAELLLKLMYTVMIPNGIGLAAPQIGVNLAVMTLSSALNDPKLSDALVNIEGKFLYAIFNPVIEFIGQKNYILPGLEGGEGCLSVPGKEGVEFRGAVYRYPEIKLTYQNITGDEFVANLSAYSATVIQHELDHLLGILFVSRMHDLRAQMSLLQKYGITFGCSSTTLNNFLNNSLNNVNTYNSIASENNGAIDSFVHINTLSTLAQTYNVSPAEVSAITSVINAINSPNKISSV